VKRSRDREFRKKAPDPGDLFSLKEPKGKRRGTAESLKNHGPPRAQEKRATKSNRREKRRRGAAEESKNRGPPKGAKEREKTKRAMRKEILCRCRLNFTGGGGGGGKNFKNKTIPRR
jgi:hypothetical protein